MTRNQVNRQVARYWNIIIDQGQLAKIALPPDTSWI